jgi:hypothetical protein
VIVGIRRIWSAIKQKDPMVFGFNTDVKHGDTVYHVQSEARLSEFLFQTQVFVRGRCIGKRATSYADRSDDPFFTDKQKEGLLRDQHRYVLDAIREGRVEEVFDKRETPEALAAVKELDLKWVNADSVHANGGLLLKLQVTEAGTPASGAKLVCRFGRPDSEPMYSQAVSDASGTGEIKLALQESALTDSSVLVQAEYNGRTTTRKFRLKRVEA